MFEKEEKHHEARIIVIVGIRYVGIDDTGSTDFNPILKCVNGNTYLLYNDLNEIVDATTENYGAVTGATQISVMRFDRGTGNFEDLGTTGVESALDLQPDIYEQDGELSLCWMSFLPGTEGVSQISSTLTDSGWSTPEVVDTPIWYDPVSLPDNAPISSSVACYDTYENVDTIFYADGDKIYSIFRDGVDWGTPIEMISLPEGTEVCSLNVGRDDYRNLYIVVSCVAPSGQTDILFYTIEELLQDIVVLSADYISETLIPGARFPDHDSELTAWIESQNNTPHALHTLYVDIADTNGLWDARAVDVDIPSGATQTIYFNFTIPKNGGEISDSYTFTIFTEEFDEPDTYNNSAVCMIRKPDLSVEGFYAVSDSETGTASVWIVNRGLTDISNATVQIFGISDPSNPLTEAQTVSLAVGCATSVTFSDIDFNSETQVITVVSGIDEENITANNSEIATVQVYTPGQLCASIISTTQDADQILVSFSVENTTSMDESALVVVASYDSSGKMLDAAVIHTESLPAGSEWSSATPLKAPSDTFGTVKLFLLTADGSCRPLQQCVESGN